MNPRLKIPVSRSLDYAMPEIPQSAHISFQFMHNTLDMGDSNIGVERSVEDN
jgi:hypothetical protein